MRVTDVQTSVCLTKRYSQHAFLAMPRDRAVLAQVYRAVLHGQRQVAVKVLDPMIHPAVATLELSFLHTGVQVPAVPLFAEVDTRVAGDTGMPFLVMRTGKHHVKGTVSWASPLNLP